MLQWAAVPAACEGPIAAVLAAEIKWLYLQLQGQQI
jgi:hypothetical protein